MMMCVEVTVAGDKKGVILITLITVFTLTFLLMDVYSARARIVGSFFIVVRVEVGT